MSEPFYLKVEIYPSQLSRLNDMVGGDVITAMVYAGGLELQRYLQVPPPKKAGAFSSMATPGQRRAYWAKVRSGQARHGSGGYIRRGDMVRKWVVKPIGRGVVKVGNDEENAKFVYGAPPLQQPFHAASGWPRVDTVLNNPQVQSKLQAAVDKKLAEMMRRL